ncbi:MAG: neutral/alkaline non-lysosomal ceramidase N-terminal domain-containing protein [Candidatus Dormiibacterota bacterium]
MTLLAGVGTADITPPCGVPHGCWGLRSGLAEGTHDPLLARALLLQEGARRIAIVSVDLVFADEHLTEQIRRRVRQLVGLSADEVLVNAAHNHSAPSVTRDQPVAALVDQPGFDGYRAALPDLVAGAVYAAHQARVPATVGAATGRAPGVSTNRVTPEADVDDTVTVLRVDAADGQSIALVVGFACHPITMGGHNLLWNADYPGVVRSVVEATWPDTACLFLQGCAGDLAPWNYWFGNLESLPMTFANRDRLGEELATRAVEIGRRIRPSRAGHLAAGSRQLALTARHLPWSLTEIDAARERLREQREPDYPKVWPDDLHTMNSAQRFPLHYQRLALESFRAIKLLESEPVMVEVQALRIGEVGLVGNPFEPFNELGVQIRAASPFSLTFPMGYCNGSHGYLPLAGDLDRIAGATLEEVLDQNLSRWAYGITNTSIERGEAGRLVEASLDALRAVYGDGR